MGGPAGSKEAEGVGKQSGMSGRECKPDAKRKRDSAQPQLEKRKRDSAQPHDRAAINGRVGPTLTKGEGRFFEYQLPILMWLVVTFIFSTDAFSANETSKIIDPVLSYLFPAFSYEQINFWHLAIRKLGHITEYFILALLAYRCLRYDESDLLEARVKTIGFILLAALLDEWHQWFTFSRGPSIVDVGYDCLGAVWALWLINIYETRYLRSHSVL